MNSTAAIRARLVFGSSNPGATGFAASTVILLWASSFVAVKVALVDIEPGPLALARYAVASLVFLGLASVRRCARPPLADLARMAAGGAIGIALYSFTLNCGQRTVSAGVASLLVNTVPIWTSLLSVALLRERIRRLGWLGILISFAGVALLSLGNGNRSGVDSAILLILAAALSQATYFVIVKPLVGRYHPIDVTSYAVWFGFLFLLPFGHGIIGTLQQCSVSTQLSILFLGTGPAALAYLAWSYVLSRLPAGKASNLLFLIPVAAIALGWLVLGERPAPIALLGGGVAILGVAVSRQASR